MYLLTTVSGFRYALFWEWLPCCRRWTPSSWGTRGTLRSTTGLVPPVRSRRRKSKCRLTQFCGGLPSVSFPAHLYWFLPVQNIVPYQRMYSVLWSQHACFLHLLFRIWAIIFLFNCPWRRRLGKLTTFHIQSRLTSHYPLLIFWSWSSINALVRDFDDLVLNHARMFESCLEDDYLPSKMVSSRIGAAQSGASS